MNTYNDNLRSTVFDFLEKQEADLLKLQSQFNASKSSLYHAQGALIDSTEKLDLAGKKLAQDAKVKGEAVKNANLSTNVLTSTSDEQTFMDLSVKNAATCASNVQIAANAVLKLSSDMGSIYSIVSAADYGTDINTLAKEAKQIMDKTAYNAEVASDKSMLASAKTAEVPYKQLGAQAELTNTSVDNILQIVDAVYDTAVETVNTDNDTQATDSKKEKELEGVLEDANVDYLAASQAYASLNSELNLNLTATQESNKEPYSIKVNCSRMLSPFQNKTDDLSVYPVESYYAIVVKYKNRATFSITDAENLQLKENVEDYLTELNSITTIIEGKPVPINLLEMGAIINIHYDPNDPKKVKKDSDGDKIDLGKNYVVFVFAIYSDKYKRKINDFENFLSAPSQQFILTHYLDAAAADNIEVDTTELTSEAIIKLQELTEEVNEEKATTSIHTDSSFSNQSVYQSTVLKFKMKPSDNKGENVEYRCMFLPMASNIYPDLLTSSGLDTVEKEVELIEEVYSRYQDQFDDIKAKETEQNGKLDTNLGDISKQQEEINSVVEQLADSKISKAAKEKLEKQKKKLEDALVKLRDTEQEIKKALSDLEEQRKELESGINHSIEEIRLKEQDKIGFYFDQSLAEMISDANYTVAQPQMDEDGKTTSMDAWQVVVAPNTTDNFGTPLIKGEEYVPVILTYSTEDEENLSKYTNALSDFNATGTFHYQTITNK